MRENNLHPEIKWREAVQHWAVTKRRWPSPNWDLPASTTSNSQASYPRTECVRMANLLTVDNCSNMLVCLSKTRIAGCQGQSPSVASFRSLTVKRSVWMEQFQISSHSHPIRHLPWTKEASQRVITMPSRSSSCPNPPAKMMARRTVTLIRTLIWIWIFRRCKRLKVPTSSTNTWC